MSSASKIWIVDDDKAVRTVCRRLLTKAGFSVEEYSDGAEAVERWRDEQPALLILDVDMPRLNGWRTLEELRRAGYTGAILMMTHVSDIPSRVRGLELGADDYLAKPFDPDELRARVKALLRRTAAATPALAAAVSAPVKPDLLHLGDVAIDLENKTALRAGAPLRLTRTDFTLLKLLADHRGKPVLRETILREVWRGHASSSHVLDTHLWRLRKKIGDGENGGDQWIRNLSGIGYVLATEAQFVRG